MAARYPSGQPAQGLMAQPRRYRNVTLSGPVATRSPSSPLKTSEEQFRVTAQPRLGRAALRALVTWVARHHDGVRPTTAMTWAQLPAPTRRRIAVLLSHLLRRPL